MASEPSGDREKKSMKNAQLVRLLLLGGGSLLLLYGLWALHSGWLISTWAQVAYRPSLIYWITVVALLVIGGVNILIALRSFFR